MSPEDQARVVKIQAVARGRAARAEVVAMRARQAAEAAAAEAEATLTAEASVEVGGTNHGTGHGGRPATAQAGVAEAREKNGGSSGSSR